MRELKSLDELMAEDEAASSEARAADLAKYDSPEEVAKRDRRRREEHEQGVRLGWWNEDGEPINVEAEDDDEDETEDDEA